jgi:hypothetical protein
MVQVILQPAANDRAFEHYRNTILRKVSLQQTLSKIDEKEFSSLKNIYGDSDFSVWGVKTGVKSRWKRINPGDIVLFYRHSTIMAYAVVTFKIYSRKLAEALWGFDEGGAPGNLSIFLKISKPLISRSVVFI